MVYYISYINIYIAILLLIFTNDWTKKIQAYTKWENIKCFSHLQTYYLYASELTKWDQLSKRVKLDFIFELYIMLANK